jgi:hypothetical protein
MGISRFYRRKIGFYNKLGIISLVGLGENNSVVDYFHPVFNLITLN